MPPKTGKKKIKKAGELRRSQLITTFGSGAIADFPHFSGIMAGIDNWNIALISEENKIHEGNLEELLGKEFFIQGTSNKDAENSGFGVPIYRFPNYYYCPECHMLDLYWKIGTESKSKTNSDLYCNKCNTKLIPSRFIVACQNGHIQDFPYKNWVKKSCNYKNCDEQKLYLEYKGATGGLDSIHIRCECKNEDDEIVKATTTMAGCMNKEALAGMKCEGKMPWIDKGYVEPDQCHAVLRTLQRNANNVYYPVKVSALTIPPWSSQIHKVLNKYRMKLEDIFEEEEPMLTKKLMKHWEKYQDEYKCMEEAFIREAKSVYMPDEDRLELTEKSIIKDEYNAFCGSNADESLFKITKEQVPSSFSALIEQVKLVKRLREVQVLKGFRRIFPEHEADENKRKNEGIFNRDFTPLSKQPLQWLPAIELYGEGIFIKFNEEKIKKWEKENGHRYKIMNDRLNQSWIGKGMFSANNAAYLMLHTFAHLLIRQLSSQCGYSTSSLKEKIYSTYIDDDYIMCGILIYTATSDSDGSLGGLVREGKEDRLENTIRALLQEASWCSNDPICIESKSQGYQALNYSACHACTLLPETSCEASNCLLDRASIIGTPEYKDIGFFNEFV